MSRLPGVLRGKLIVAEYGPMLAIALTIVGVVALGSAGWIYTHPPTTTVTDSTNEQTFRSTLRTSALVTGDSVLYGSGTRLENQPIYFVGSTPNLTLTLRTSVPNDRAVRVDQRLELVMRATHDEDVFWQRTRPLASDRTTTSNGTLTTSATLDIPGLKRQLKPVRNEIGTAGSLEVFVRVTTSYETSQYSGTLNRTVPLQLFGNTFAVEHATLKTTERTPKTREIVIPTRDVFAYAFPAVVGVGALVGAAIVGITYRRQSPLDTLLDRVHQARYAEWISAGTLSPDVGDRYVPVESLEDLVDIGIDTSKRVLYDAERDVYAVIDGLVVYYYARADKRTSQTDGSARTSDWPRDGEAVQGESEDDATR